MPDNGEELISNPDTPPKKLHVQDYQEDEQTEEWANFNDLRNSKLNLKLKKKKNPTLSPDPQPLTRLSVHNAVRNVELTTYFFFSWRPLILNI